MKEIQKLVILDRDGVINQLRENGVRSPEEWEVIPKSLDAIAYLNQFGYRVAVASNQSGIGLHHFSIHDLNAVHAKMERQLQLTGAQVDGYWFCPHTEKDDCTCRKPKTGMLEDLLERFGAVAAETYMVGDSIRDLEAYQAVGGLPILVLTGKGKKTLQEYELPENVQVFEDLWAFSRYVVHGAQ